MLSQIQGASADSDEDDDGRKVSRKKGLAGALFGEDEDAGGEGGAAAAASASRGRSGRYNDVDSDDSMADFIEDDDDEPAGGGDGDREARGGGGGRGRARQRMRREQRSGEEDHRVARADDMFGEDEYDEEDLYPEPGEQIYTSVAAIVAMGRCEIRDATP